MTSIVKPREANTDVVAELKADVIDLYDRLLVAEQRLSELTVEVDELHELLADTQPHKITTALGTLGGNPGSDDDVDGIGRVGMGPWTPYLEAIRAIGPVRQKQVLLIQGLWAPYGLTASEIASDLNEKYPAHLIRMPNVYPLIKAMVSKGLLQITPDTNPVRYTIRRAPA